MTLSFHGSKYEVVSEIKQSLDYMDDDENILNMEALNKLNMNSKVSIKLIENILRFLFYFFEYKIKTWKEHTRKQAGWNTWIKYGCNRMETRGGKSPTTIESDDKNGSQGFRDYTL